MAAALIKRGSRVIIADINLENSQQTALALGNFAEAMFLDVTDNDAVEALFADISARYGTVDCLVNCAGINNYAEVLETKTSDWIRVLSTNLTGTIFPSLAAYRIMAKHRQGTIINMGSMATFLVSPMFAPYTTSKFGVVGFSRALAVEAEAHGINVSVVCPGNIITPMRGVKYELSRFTPDMPVEQAVETILRDVERRRRIIVFPKHAKLLWWLDRLCPSLLNPIRRKIFKRAQARIKTG
jgi:NAD(P)-dependent dehydrogenase (short-subunit alcohol dehydrogenase family)